MLIKILRHKRRSNIHHLLKYMVDGMESEQDLMIAHNLPSFDLGTMSEAFLANDAYRTDRRATVTWYHEILSFSPLDSTHLSNEKLEEIAREYIHRRNENSLCFAVSHLGDNHKHVHLCFSAVEYKSDKSLRMSNEDFRALREGMEQWQREHFPEIEYSSPYLNPTRKRHPSRIVQQDKNKRQENEVQAKKRLGKKPLIKEQLACALQDCYDKSQTMQEFVEHVQSAGFDVYERNGKVAGIVHNRKYRFSTVGIRDEMLLSLSRLQQRQQEMEALARPDRGYDRER